MRGKAIIIGAMGVVALATLTANAQNSTTRTATGSVTTLLAATTQVAVVGEQVNIAARATTKPVVTTEATTKPAEKTDVASRTVTPRVTLSAGCQAAITHLKDLHTADVAEDAAERAASASTTAASDQAEDTAEAQPWKTALLAARTACVPQLSTQCRSAIAGLTITVAALHTDELGESQERTEHDSQADSGAVRTAFSAVQTACPEHD